MEDILQELNGFNNVSFPFQNFKSITEYVSVITKKYKIPYSAYKTDGNRKTFIYICSFGGESRSNIRFPVKTNCESILVFIKNIRFDGTSIFNFDFNKSIIRHNHSLEPEFIEAHRNCLDIQTIHNIKQQEAMGILPGRIRSNLNININSNIFYNLRRNEIEQSKNESFETFINFLKNTNDFKIKLNTSEGKLSSATFVYKKVCDMPYSSDLAIIDDTASTNIYGLALELIAVVDQDKHTQILSFGFLEDKSYHGFFSFFQDFKELTNDKKFRIIIIDRLSSQINALKDVFKESVLVFCHTHIRRNLVNSFGINSGIVKNFDNLENSYLICENYIKFLIEERKKMLKIKGIKVIEELIRTRNNWLPSDLIRQGVNFKFSTSRIEGVFGIIKQHYGHERSNITNVVKYIANECRLLMTQSYSKRGSIDFYYQGFPLINLNELHFFGKLVLNILEEEYNSFLENKSNEMCVWCNLRKMNSPYRLPCRHVINSNTIINIEEIHSRYIRNDNIYSTSTKSKIILSEIHNSSQISFKYNDIMSRIQPYAAAAQHNNEIANIFSNTFKQLENNKIVLNLNMPTTISMKGCISVHPSNNVIFGGKPKLKNLYHCKICGKCGHNRKRCPYNKK